MTQTLTAPPTMSATLPPAMPATYAATPSSAAKSVPATSGGLDLRKFTAATLSDCLNQVKSELGPQAVVLATRTVKVPVFFGLIKREQIEITAGRGLRRNPKPAAPQQPAPQMKPIVPGQDLLASSAASTSAVLGVTKEVSELKKLVGDLTSQFQNSQTPDLPPTLAQALRQLKNEEVSAGLAREIVETVRDALPAEALKDDAAVQAAVVDEVARRLPTAGESKRPAPGRPHIVALVGPTGVGKTTTIAKLAADMRVRRGAKVALITIDTYRIAAVDQLRRYAEIIDAPLLVVNTPQEIADAVARVADHDYVLIDTAGRSPRDAVKLKELQDFLAAAKPAETHLVLSTTCGRPSMMLAIERFASVKADKMIFTKLDEADGVGATLDAVAARKLPVSYLTVGQDVPDDIELADSRKLAERILSRRDQ